jgi:pSer/pThr/pTyr-binding forkhead associated (FHA) protein
MDNGAIFCDFCGHELSARPKPMRSTPLSGSLAVPYAPSVSPPTAREVARLPNAIVLQLTQNQRFTLRGKADYIVGRIGVGREPPEVDLAAWYGYEGGVSREHMAIHVRPEGVFIEDLDSRNETIHNGFRLMPRQWYPLRDGDEIRLGAITLRVAFYFA